MKRTASSFAGTCLGMYTCADEACIQNLHAHTFHKVCLSCLVRFQIWTSEVFTCVVCVFPMLSAWCSRRPSGVQRLITFGIIMFVQEVGQPVGLYANLQLLRVFCFALCLATLFEFAWFTLLIILQLCVLGGPVGFNAFCIAPLLVVSLCCIKTQVCNFWAVRTCTCQATQKLQGMPSHAHKHVAYQQVKFECCAARWVICISNSQLVSCFSRS